MHDNNFVISCLEHHGVKRLCTILQVTMLILIVNLNLNDVTFISTCACDTLRVANGYTYSKVQNQSEKESCYVSLKKKIVGRKN